MTMAQGLHLVRDINRTPDGELSSRPAGMVNLGGRAYFAAQTVATGREVFSASATPGDAQLLAAIYPGGVFGDRLLVAGNQLFFADTSLSTGLELWVSDGTSANTRVLDLNPGPASSGPWMLAALDDLAIFAQSNLSVWASDGTLAGTRLLTSANATAGKGATLGSVVVFQARDASGSELWVTDGTPPGTRLLVDLNPGGDGYTGAANRDLVVMGGALYFRGNDGFGAELCKTDGTASGTVRVAEINPIGASNPDNLVAAGTRLFFDADDGVHGRQLWVTDGTGPGTIQLTSRPSASVSESEALGELLLFASPSERGNELWISDGTPAGTRMLADISPGSRSSNPRSFGQFGQELFFAANAAAGVGEELWKTDGTAAGTMAVADIRAVGGSQPHGFHVLGNTLMFAADDGIHGEEVWTSDGTSAGTKLLHNINAPTRSARPSDLVDVNGTLFFVADDGVQRQVWTTDGTEANTVMLTSSPDPAQLVRAGNRVFFAAGAGGQLWVTDGTQNGTALVRAFAAGSLSMLGSLDDRLLFAADDGGGAGGELWRSDGTPGGTFLLADIRVGPLGSSPGAGGAAVVIDQQIWFAADDGVIGTELWKTDGTGAGTVLLSDLEPGAGSSSPRRFAQCGDRVCFFAARASTGLELWASDGTASGTALLFDTAPGTVGGVKPDELVRSGQRLYFVARVSEFGVDQLWVSDGTAAGTRSLGGRRPRELTPGGGANGLFFIHEVDCSALGMTNAEYWSWTDGTFSVQQPPCSQPPNANGTRLNGVGERTVYQMGFFVTSLRRSSSTILRSFFAIGDPFLLSNGRVFFVADDGTHGSELWVHDAPGGIFEYLGPGCSEDGFPPQLDTSDPVIGATLSFDLHGAKPGTGGALWIGLPHGQTLVGPGRNCHFYFPLQLVIELGPLVPDAGGCASFAFPVVNDPALIGLQVNAQAVQWYTFNSLGLDYSNGVRLTFGM